MRADLQELQLLIDVRSHFPMRFLALSILLLITPFLAPQARQHSADGLILKTDAAGKVLPWGPATAPYIQSWTLAERVANQYPDPYAGWNVVSKTR